MGLEVCLIFKQHVFICRHYIAMSNGVIEIVVTGFLKSFLDDVFHLGFQLLVFLQLLLLWNFRLLLLTNSFLVLVFLFYRVIDHVPLLFQVTHSPNKVYEFEMWTSIRALIGEPTLLLVFILRLLPFNIAVIKHVNTDEVRHLVIHFFSLAKLERQVFILFVLLRILTILSKIILNQLGRRI